MNGTELLAKTKESPVIPVFSHENTEIAYAVLKTCYEAGVRVFEFTNRTEKAASVYAELWQQKQDFPDLALGIGTIMDETQGNQFINLGTDFIVAPIVDLALAKLCEEHELSWTPGCGTLTEVILAERNGARLIKVFPADVLGAAFIKGVKAPCPKLNLMPTGGVTPEEGNLKTWFSAGAHCVGMGSQLIPKHFSGSEEDVEQLQEKIKSALSIIKSF